MATELQILAWDVLADSWTVRWALILGAGALAALTRRAGAAFRPPRNFQPASQVISLAALVLCLDAIRFVPDTFAIESENPQALATMTCTPSKSALWAPSTWQCREGGSLRTARSSPVLEEGKPHQVQVLASSLLLVAAKRCSNEQCTSVD